VPFEFPSGVRETIRHFWIEYDFGACFSLSHRRQRIAWLKRGLGVSGSYSASLFLLREQAGNCPRQSAGFDPGQIVFSS